MNPTTIILDRMHQQGYVCLFCIDTLYNKIQQKTSVALVLKVNAREGICNTGKY